MELSEKELELQQLYGLDMAQLRWRRWCLAANCGGSEDVFCQEYPSEAAEAFLTSGRPVFDPRLLTAALAAAPEGRLGQLSDRGGGLRFEQEVGRFLRLYREPQPGGDYIIGADVAAGFRGGDYSACCVLDKADGRVAACWHGHMEPELFACELLRLGQWYNRALLVPEANNHGIAVLGELKRAGYGHIWRRANQEPGFLTTQTSKAAMIGALAAFIREDAGRICDHETLHECLSYVYDERGHTNAASGAHDDRVIALALAVYVFRERPTGPRVRDPDLFAAYGINSTTGY